MQVVIVLIVVIVCLYFALHYWYITVPVAVIIAVLYIANEARKRREAEEAIRQAEQDRLSAEEAARLQRYQEEQNRYRVEMIHLAKESIERFELMPKYLNNAERELDEAESNFKEGAFAPFWDSIEASANSLGHF